MIDEKARSLEFLQAIYCNNELPLPVRMRAAIAALPFESPKLAVTAVVSESDFATLLDRRLKHLEELRLIEAKPSPINNSIEADKTNGRIAPPIPDKRFRRI